LYRDQGKKLKKQKRVFGARAGGPMDERRQKTTGCDGGVPAVAQSGIETPRKVE
jgi:hypothetical protein